MKDRYSPLGPLPLGWDLMKLKKLTQKIGSGATPRGGSAVYLPVRKKFALIRSQNVFDRSFDESGLAFISEEDANDLESSAVQKDDILLNITGDGITFGRACLVPENILPAYVNQHVCIIRTDPLLCKPGYLLSYLTHPLVKNYIESFNAGGSRRAITKGHIESFDIPLPSLPEQETIALILNSLDMKIGLNSQINDTLEEMAEEIFKYWFIEFSPVHSKTSNHTPFVISKEVETLFPNSFEIISGRKIPKGWKISSLDQIANYLNGLALQNYPAESDDFLPVIKIAQMRRGNTEGSDKASTAIPAAYIVEDGDILFSWSGSLELMIWCGGRGALNQHLFKVSSNQYPKWFYYFWIKYHLPKLRFIAQSKVTTMGHIQRHHLTEAEVIVPSVPLLEAANQVIAPLINEVIANHLQSRTLASLRDTLLPMLISGKLQVRPVE